MKLSELIDKYGDCEVSEELLEMIETKGDWEPKYKENYFLVSENGEVVRDVNYVCNYDKFRISKRNCYRTEEEAQFALDMYNFCKERSFEPDWDAINQPKAALCLDYHDRTVSWATYRHLRYFIPFYYPTKEAVQEIIDKYSFEELAKYYGRV